jgi:hypothetical protein
VPQTRMQETLKEKLSGGGGIAAVTVAPSY